MMWGYPGSCASGWWWGFGLLHMLLYWGVVILVIALLVKWLLGSWSLREQHSGNRYSGHRAMDLLEERYARGEIGKEEFEQKKRDLEE